MILQFVRLLNSVKYRPQHLATTGTRFSKNKNALHVETLLFIPLICEA